MKRLVSEGRQGRIITLKLKVKRPGAPEPAKHLGHGICDSLSRSHTLPTATDDAAVVRKQFSY